MHDSLIISLMAEVFSSRFSDGSRTYFFDVKEHDGEMFLAITMSHTVRNVATRQRVVLRGRAKAAFIKNLRTALARLPGGTSTYQEEQKMSFPSAYAKWTDEEDERLLKAYVDGYKVADMARMLARNPGAIRSRIAKLTDSAN